MDSKTFDVLIIGSGAAAYSAAIYARRYNLTTGIVEKSFGGYTAISGIIENYPGTPKIDGYELMSAMRTQAVDDLGATIIEGEAVVVKNEHHCFQVRVGDQLLHAKTLVLATGMERRTLNLPNEAEYRTKGVHYCATCDGAVYKGKRVVVVGGGDGAVKNAYQLVDMGAEHVFLIVREDDIARAEPVNRDRLNERIAGGKATILYGTEVREYLGGPPLSGIRLSKPHEGKDTLEVAAVFIEIGSTPRNAIAKELGVTLTERGEVHVDPVTMATNVDGVFACGDVTDASGSFKQIVTSAAQGAIAATSAYTDVSEHGGACAMHAVAIPQNRFPMTT